MREFGAFDIYDQSIEANPDEDLFYLPKDQFSVVSTMLPERLRSFSNMRILNINDDVQDPRFQEVWNYLSAIGYGPVELTIRAKKTDKQFYYVMRREYSDDELLNAEYLNVSLGTPYTDRYESSPEHPILIYENEISKKKSLQKQVGCVRSDQWFFVRGAVRSEMEKQGIRVQYSDVLNVAKLPIPEFYKLQSSLLLPPLQGVSLHKGLVIDGFFREPQLRFQSAAFRTVGDFDLAYIYRYSVCSQRLFRVLRKYDKTARAIPIQLIES